MAFTTGCYCGSILLDGVGGDWQGIKTTAMMDNVGINYKGWLPQARRQKQTGEVESALAAVFCV